ncbi:hypothetical protein SCUP515_12905 [Seiridium cupressi]
MAEQVPEQVAVTAGLPIPKGLPRGEQWRIRELKRLRLMKHDRGGPKWADKPSSRVRRCSLRVPPPIIVKRVERRYSRKQKATVLHWMLHAYVPRGEANPTGAERPGLPAAHQRPYDIRQFRAVTTREAGARFQVPAGTLANWWKNRKKYLPASEFAFENEPSWPPPTEQQRQASLANNPPPPPDAGAPMSLDEIENDEPAAAGDDDENEEDNSDDYAEYDDDDDDSLERELEAQLNAELDNQRTSWNDQGSQESEEDVDDDSEEDI